MRIKRFISIVIMLSLLLVGSTSLAKTNMDRAQECLEELNIAQYYDKIVSVRLTYFGSFEVTIYIIAETKASHSPVLLVARHDKKLFGRGLWRLLRVDKLNGETRDCQALLDKTWKERIEK